MELGEGKTTGTTISVEGPPGEASGDGLEAPGAGVKASEGAAVDEGVGVEEGVGVAEAVGVGEGVGVGVGVGVGHGGTMSSQV